MSFFECSQLLHGLNLLFMFRRAGALAPLSGMPDLQFVKSSPYSVFAEKVAIADGLNPLMTSQRPITNSWIINGTSK